MKHSFPELHQKHPHLAARMVHEGKLSPNQMWIELPEDFNFAGEPLHHPPRPRTIEATPSPKPIAKKPKIPEPTLAELAGNFTHAIAAWTMAGFPTVSASDYTTRAAICAPCQYWQPTARAGLGKCAHKGCGCTKLKRYLASEKCPLNLWPAIESAGASRLPGFLPRLWVWLQTKTAALKARLTHP